MKFIACVSLILMSLASAAWGQSCPLPAKKSPIADSGQIKSFGEHTPRVVLLHTLPLSVAQSTEGVDVAYNGVSLEPWGRECVTLGNVTYPLSSNPVIRRNVIRIWSADHWKLLCSFNDPVVVDDAEFFDHGAKLAICGQTLSADEHGFIGVIDIQRARRIAWLSTKSDTVRKIVPSPVGHVLFALLFSDRDIGTEVVDTRTWRPIYVPSSQAPRNSHPARKPWARLSKDSLRAIWPGTRYMISEEMEDGGGRLWNISSGRRVVTPIYQSMLDTLDLDANWIVFSSNGAILAAPGLHKKNSVLVYEAKRGKLLCSISDPTFGDHPGLCVSPSGTRLMISGKVGDPVLFDVPSGKRIATLKNLDSRPIFTQDGRYILSTSFGKELPIPKTSTILIFDAMTGKELSATKESGMLWDAKPLANKQIFTLADSQKNIVTVWRIVD